MFDLFLSYFSVAMAKPHDQNTYKRNSLFGDNSFRALVHDHLSREQSRGQWAWC